VTQLAKTLVVVGLVIAAIGALLWLGERVGLGRLPGDLHWRGKNFTIAFPIATSILISVVLTVVLNLWLKNR
jgi:hypothetical protein